MSGSSVKAAMLLGVWWDVSFALVAQLVERLLCKHDVVSSNLSEGSIFLVEVQVSRLHPLETRVRCLTTRYNNCR